MKREAEVMMNRSKTLRYLGGLSGQGVVSQNGKALARAAFDFDGYFHAVAGVTGCGEIQASPEVLQGLFGRPDLQFLTDGGLLLDMSFSDAKLAPASDAAPVDVKGHLPTTPADWRH
jgi:hypothetical protein